MKAKIIITIAFMAYCSLLTAQVQEDWVARYNGPGNSADVAFSLAVDTSGNVYVTKIILTRLIQVQSSNFKFQNYPTQDSLSLTYSEGKLTF